MALRPMTGGLPKAMGRLGRAVPLLLGVLLAGCASTGDGEGLLSTGSQSGEQTGSLAAGPAGPTGAAAARDYWAEAYGKNPRDERAIIGYARALRAEGSKDKALSLLQQAAIYNSDSRAIASEEGRLALEVGQTDLASKLLTRANDASAPDWRILNALGTIQAQQGNKTVAQRYFEAAARLAPGEASVLNNLALAYALDGDPAKAETLLRKAVAAGGDVARVRQNLALVLGVEGKLDEAREIGSADLSKDKADSNRAYLQKMVAATPMVLGKHSKTALKPVLAVPAGAWSTATSTEPAAGWSPKIAQTAGK